MSEPEITYQPASDDAAGSAAGFVALMTGRLISLFVHETNNHLATLRESAGLGDDIIAARSLPDREKLKELERLLCAMDDRIGHASSLVRTFGELGRHLETPTATLDISLAVDEIMPFVSKIARQKNVTVRTYCDCKLPSAPGDIFCLQCLILALFDNLCSALAPQTAVAITTNKTPAAVVVSLSADGSAASEGGMQPWPWNKLEIFAAANGFEISRHQQGGAVTIAIRRKE